MDFLQDEHRLLIISELLELLDWIVNYSSYERFRFQGSIEITNFNSEMKGKFYYYASFTMD